MDSSLLEGIDDPRFQIVAFFQKLQNARSLVQQVGRIIRNPRQVGGAKGYVLDHWSGYHRELWDGFQAYDNVIHEHGPSVFTLSTGTTILDKLVELQPLVGYLEGRFRSKFNFDTIDPQRDIQVPLRANMVKKDANFDLDACAERIVELYEEDDRVVRHYSPARQTRLILSVKWTHSPFLRRHSFVEADLQVTIVREFKEYVAAYDSSGSSLMSDSRLGLGHPLEAKVMKKLFRPSKDGKLTAVSLVNSDLSTSAIRSRSITAWSIEATVPGFTDYAQICTTAEGYSNDAAGGIRTTGLARRYVGFSKGRITQSTANFVPLPAYLEWLDALGSILESGDSASLRALDRYALEVEAPTQTDPRSILLDIEEAKDAYYPRDSSDQPVIIEDVCANVTNGAFRVTANGQQVDAEVKYVNGRYKITSDGLDGMYVRRDGESLPGSIVRYLNNNQSFRVLPEDLTRVYVRGQFYRPTLKVGLDFERADYALGNCFVTNDTIGLCSSEKGRKSYYNNNDADWDPESLFGIISRCGNRSGTEGHFGNPDIILCDDVGTEIADFILCETDKPRVIFVHAKASHERHDCSASGLHEVCAQAVKNLGYLAMFNDQKPSKLGSWDQEWNARIAKDFTARVAKRIHRGNRNGAELWRQLRVAINNPMVDKEVWLFTGNLLSKKCFEDGLGQAAPPAHIVQAAYLLHATMSDTAAVGAKLKIFCAK